MNRERLKNKFKEQAASFETDVKNKLAALISGKGVFKPKEEVSRDMLYDAFMQSSSQQSGEGMTSEKKQFAVSKIMLLRGLSLPGGYLKN